MPSILDNIIGFIFSPRYLGERFWTGLVGGLMYSYKRSYTLYPCLFISLATGLGFSTVPPIILLGTYGILLSLTIH